MAGSDNISGLIAEYIKLLRRPLDKPDVAASVLSTVLPVRGTKPVALLLTPHPDDECLFGALPLRLLREQGWQIINLAMTLGSKADRRAARKTELAQACATLGFDCLLPDADGFSGLTPMTRDSDQVSWAKMVTRVADMIAQLQPTAIFMPHVQDAHPTHIGVHHLGMDALLKQRNDFVCAVIQTEYWQPIAEPNLMIGIGEKEVTDLLAALTCHAGEVARNPYDLRFPAYLIDNVRRGSERVRGQGKEAAPMDFAMLYEYGVWKQNRYLPSALRRIVGPQDSLAEILEN
jgi:LmbE family N-acetylglucosaminyl deacetylase